MAFAEETAELSELAELERAEAESDDVVEDGGADAPAATAVAVAVVPANGAEGAGAGGETAAVTLQAAVNAYFDYEAEREAKREKRRRQSSARRGAGSASARPPRKVFVLDEAGREAVTRFLAHFGPQTPMRALSPKQMESYQETIGANAMDLDSRLTPVKEFLRFCAKQDYTNIVKRTTRRTVDGNTVVKETWGGENLGNYLRIQKKAWAGREAGTFRQEEAETFQMTEEGKQSLERELQEAVAEMPNKVAAVAAAREDKDIRENAPLEAAREEQERLQSRINEIEYRLERAVVVTRAEPTGRAQIESKIRLLQLDPIEREHQYTLVGATEGDVAAKKLSIDSPIGRAVLDKTEGSEVQVDTPSGTLRFLLQEVS